MLVKFLNFLKVCMFLISAMSVILVFGLVGGIEQGQPLLQNMFYIVCSIGLSVVSLFVGLAIDMEISRG